MIRIKVRISLEFSQSDVYSAALHQFGSVYSTLPTPTTAKCVTHLFLRKVCPASHPTGRLAKVDSLLH